MSHHQLKIIIVHRSACAHIRSQDQGPSLALVTNAVHLMVYEFPMQSANDPTLYKSTNLNPDPNRGCENATQVQRRHNAINIAADTCNAIKQPLVVPEARPPRDHQIPESTVSPPTKLAS